MTRTGGTIYPGLIELHNHLSYNALPLWQLTERFEQPGSVGAAAEYRQLVSRPAGLLGTTDGLVQSVVRYVEAKCLVAGVTTTQGIALASNNGIRRFYRGVVRNVEQTDDPDLPEAMTRIADVDAARRRGVPRAAAGRQDAAAASERRRRRHGARPLPALQMDAATLGDHPARSAASTAAGCGRRLRHARPPRRHDGVVAVQQPAPVRRDGGRRARQRKAC